MIRRIVLLRRNKESIEVGAERRKQADAQKLRSITQILKENRLLKKLLIF